MIIPSKSSRAVTGAFSDIGEHRLALDSRKAYIFYNKIGVILSWSLSEDSVGSWEE